MTNGSDGFVKAHLDQIGYLVTNTKMNPFVVVRQWMEFVHTNENEDWSMRGSAVI